MPHPRFAGRILALPPAEGAFVVLAVVEVVAVVATVALVALLLQLPELFPWIDAHAACDQSVVLPVPPLSSPAHC